VSEAHVRLLGEIDVSTIEQVRQDLSDAVAGNPGAVVLVDMSEVSFLDSSGVGALITALKAATAEGGALGLRGVQPQGRKVFELTGLARVMELE